MKRRLVLGMVVLLLAALSAWADVPAPGTILAPEKVQTAAAAQPNSLLQPSGQDEKMETLLEGNVYAHGGYGGPGVKVTTLDGRTECLVGGRFDYLVNHHINIGIAGYGLASDDFTKTINGTKRRLGMGYGGLDVGYTFAPYALVHITLEALVGAGGIGYEYTTDHWKNDGNNQGHWENAVQGDAFFVAEPTLLVELNVTKWCRFCLGAGYRYVSGVDENVVGVNSAALCGANAELALKFGWF